MSIRWMRPHGSQIYTLSYPTKFLTISQGPRSCQAAEGQVTLELGTDLVTKTHEDNCPCHSCSFRVFSTAAVNTGFKSDLGLKGRIQFYALNCNLYKNS